MRAPPRCWKPVRPSAGLHPAIQSVTAMLRWHVALTTRRRPKQAASVCNKTLLLPGYCCAKKKKRFKKKPIRLLMAQRRSRDARADLAHR